MMMNTGIVIFGTICLALNCSSHSIVSRSIQSRAGAIDAVKWMNLPDGDNWNIPYVVQGVNVKAEAAIQAAVNDFQAATCLRFVHRTTEEFYLRFVDDGGCYAQVGRRTDKPNTLSVSRGCEHKGIVLHELMHTIGFYHEQARPDRDEHISIVNKNIMQYQMHNFKKLDESKVESYGVPYDVASIMHYPPWAFSNNGEDTIRGVNGEKIVNTQHQNLSPMDIAQVNAMYECKNYITAYAWESSNYTDVTNSSSRKPEALNACKDLHEKCEMFARRGRCTRRKKWMSMNCQKSCSLCL